MRIATQGIWIAIGLSLLATIAAALGYLPPVAGAIPQPDYVTFSGYADQYRSDPITAHAGQRLRLFVLNAGPSQFSAFHVIGAIFSDYYVDGNPANHLVGDQTITIPPGGGAMVELTMEQAGQYPFVTHSFSGAMTGATGVFNVQ